MADATRPRRWRTRLFLITLMLLLLEFFPGVYTIEDFQDEWEVDSPEGLALMALDELRLDAELAFHRPTRQRISRNAELLIPTDTQVTLNASMSPVLIDGEVVAKPRIWELHSNRSMTFVYRGVTVARAKRMQIRNDDPELRVRAIGTYRVWSALFTAHRYHRQREVRRAYEPADRAVLNVLARFQPEHLLALSDTLSVQTGNTPTQLHLQNFTWDTNRWTDGKLDLNLSLSDPEPFLNTLATDLLADPIELGGFLAMKFRRLHALTLVENGFFVHMDGSITSATSKTIKNVFDPSFETRLEFAFTFPEGQTLEEAAFGARLKQIHSFDINGSNTVLDKAVRNLARKYREDLTVSLPLAPELPDHPTIPLDLTFDRFRFMGAEDRSFRLDIQAHIPPGPTGNSPAGNTLR